MEINRPGYRLTKRAFDYLLAIYILTIQRKRSARLTEISQYVGVTAPSAYEYISELVEMGYIYKMGRGQYSLTPQGVEAILRRIWAHGVLEEMLVRVFKIDIEAACSIASNIDLEIEQKEIEKICSTLGHPRKCPHGMKIPHGGGFDEALERGMCIKIARE
jgi:DtxR family Mn-dependent transcriptional regulator